MSKPVVEVQVRAVAAVSGGCAVFLGNEDKVFVMFVDQSVGMAINHDPLRLWSRRLEPEIGSVCRLANPTLIAEE
jgi:hypothetical protein